MTDFIASSSVALNEVKYWDFASKYVLNFTFSVDNTSGFGLYVKHIRSWILKNTILV